MKRVAKPVKLGALVLLLACFVHTGSDHSRIVSAETLRAGPNSVELKYVRAATVERWPGSVLVEWQTISELDTVGFNVMRSVLAGGSAGGPFERANQELILAVGEGLGGATYSFQDHGLSAGVTYYYFIQAVENAGDPIDYTDLLTAAIAWYGSFLPTVVRQ